MDIFHSDFMKRARYLPENQRAFLLDKMEQTRLDMMHLMHLYNETYRYDFKKRKETYTELNISLQSSIISMWFLLNNPKERSVLQIEQRLQEITTMFKSGRFENLYAAMMIIKKNDGFESHLGFSDEKVPNDFRTQYKTILENYCQLSENKRAQFIGEITHPYSQFKTNIPFLTKTERD